MKFFLLINVKMPTIVGILTFMSRENSILHLSEPDKSWISWYFYTYEHLKFHAQLSWAQKKFYNLGPRLFILTTAEIHDDCMARLGHEHMAVDSKEFFRPGRWLFLGRLPPSGVVLDPPLIDPSGWEANGGGSVLFPPSKSLLVHWL